MSHHLLEFKDVRFRYPDGTEALKGISFLITHGESVGIVGANGAGKSTLLLHMNGHLLPASGFVTVGEVPLRKETRPEIRRKVGVVFQNPDDQLFMPTVFDDVAFGPLNLGLTGDEVEERVHEALARVGAGHLRDKPPYRLSGGEKKRNEILQMAVLAPRLSILDETDSGLDIDALRVVAGGVNQLATRDNAIVLVTHYQRLLNYIVPDYVHVMEAGRIIKTGGKELAVELETRGYDWVSAEYKTTARATA